jgi:hypothetical protein
LFVVLGRFARVGDGAVDTGIGPRDRHEVGRTAESTFSRTLHAVIGLQTVDAFAGCHLSARAADGRRSGLSDRR